jgi:hypothetical protein
LDLIGAFEGAVGFDLARAIILPLGFALALGLGFALVSFFASVTLAPILGLVFEVDLPRFAEAIRVPPTLVVLASRPPQGDKRFTL